MKWILFYLALLAAVVATAISAMAYGDFPAFYDDHYNNDYHYHYYEEDSGLPVISGPYPRYYLAYNDWDDDKDYRFDDFNHFDDFRGYSDLDVIYGDGTVHVIRNEYQRELDMTGIDTSGKMFGKHVYGYLPDGALYRKHYMHEHDWDMDHDYYDYAHFTPIDYSRPKPVYTRNCRSISACQYARCC